MAARATESAQIPTPAPAPTATRLIPVPDWNDYHPWPPAGGMRHLIFHADSNGFTNAFKRVGRRVLVDETEFFRCVEAGNQPAALKAAPRVRRQSLPRAVAVLEA